MSEVGDSKLEIIFKSNDAIKENTPAYVKLRHSNGEIYNNSNNTKNNDEK